MNRIEGLPLGTAFWHFWYRRWYDNKKNGNYFRAKVYGWIADRVVGLAK